MDRESTYESLLKLGAWAAIVAVTIQTAAHFVYAYVWPSLLLNADNDWATFAWVSSVVTFSGALAASVLAAVGPERGPKLALAAILALFSFDEGVRLHERLAAHVDSLIPWEEAGRAAGMLVLLPLMAVAFVVLWRLSGGEAGRVRGQIRLGLGLLVTATLLEAVVSTLIRHGGWRGTDLPMVLEVVIEEGAELGGWILIVTGVAAIGFRVLFLLDAQEARGDVASIRDTVASES